MKSIDTSNLKGTEDFFGKEQIIRNYIIDTLKNIFNNYGYLPLDTSILNNYDLLAYKYNDGAEILKEIYKLTDQGNRELALRYDLTIPFCKFIANQKELRLPLRRYEIGKVFRNGPVKLGRCREFYQCDCDIVGIDGTDIEVEQMIMVIETFRRLGIDIIVKWNNRKLMTSLIKYAGINIDTDMVIGVIDKKEKMSLDNLYKEFESIGISNDMASKLMNLFSMNISEYNNLDYDDELFREALIEINDVNNKIILLGLTDNTVFTPTLARGLSIYTGIVFEFYDKLERLTCSLGGGGRYNKIITDFINDGNEYPAIGLSFGLEPIYTILKSNLEENSLYDVYIIPMEEDYKVLELATILRNNNISTIVEYSKRKLKKCFEFADKNNIKYVIVLGSRELEMGVYTIKDMEKQEQYEFNLEELLEYLKK